MGKRIRAHDWSSTPLGPPEAWPQALRSALSISLHSSFPTAIYWGPELQLIYNDAWAPIPADRHPWALGRPGAEVWADIWDVVGPQFEKVMKTGEGFSTFDQLLWMERNGVPTETYWNYSFTPLLDEEGGVVGVLNQGNETTDRVLADRRRAAETERQRRQFEQAPGFIAILDGPDHRFEFVNATYERLFGDRSYVGKTVREVFPELEGQTVFGLMDKVVETGERFIANRMPIRLTGEDGSLGPERYLDFIYAPVTNESGEVTGIFCEGHDSTEIYLAQEKLRQLNESLEQRVAERTIELQKTQEALRQSQKLEAMGQLTGGVAHDFNNLLTPIIGSLDMLQRKRAGDDRTQRLIDGALQSAERAKTLVQRLLAFARRQPLQPVAVDVAALVNGMASLIESTTSPQVRIEVNLADGIPPALADANQVEMALLNLAVNARDAMPEGGTLIISASAVELGSGHQSQLPAGSYVQLGVKDTGVGMDDATLRRAVEPFFSTKGIGQGTGLGLSMVHGLASQLGGALTISSRPNEGTTVDLWLPTAEHAATSALASAAIESSTGAGDVLLVDDEELVRASTADMLQELGFKVTEAGSAEDAVQLLSKGYCPDLLVTDHLMPGKSGTALIREAKGFCPDIRVLIVSGYADDTGLADDIPRLIKPFRHADLANSLSIVMGGSSGAIVNS
jgi:signal transduction histidine kinase